jgi:hypothetical protein
MAYLIYLSPDKSLNMKPFILLTCLSLLVTSLQAQRSKISHKATHKLPAVIKGCPPIIVDITTGTVTTLKPAASFTQVKSRLPCFTGETKEGSVLNCGGGVFFGDRDLYFYTERDFIEIRKNFKGVFRKDGLELDIIGMEVKTFNILIGDEPSRTLSEDDTDNYTGVWATSYGSLRVTFVQGVVSQVAIHSQSPDKIRVCD